MMHDITLKFGSTYDGAGFAKVQDAMRSTAAAASRTSRIFTTVTNEMGALTGAAGQAARAVGGLVGAILSGGVWGLVAAGISAAVAALVKWVGAAEKAQEETKKLADEMGNLADKAGRAALKVQEMGDQMAQARLDDELKVQEALLKEYETYGDLERQIRQVETAEKNRYEKFAQYNLKIAAAQEDVRSAEARVASAKATAARTGSDVDFMAYENALKGLELATLKLEAAENDKADAERKHAAVVREREEAEAAALKALEAENAARQAQFDKENEAADTAKVLQDYSTEVEATFKDALKEIEKEMAGLKKESAKWEKEAEKARTQSFDDWYKNTRRSDADAERQARRQANYAAVAAREAEQLRARGVVADADSNRADSRRLAYLESYNGMQGEANNPFEQAIQRL